jgi:hypothetical protein
MVKKASDTRASFGKSRVTATLASVGRWTLVVLVLCLALIGFLHLMRGTAVRHVRGVATDGMATSGLRGNPRRRLIDARIAGDPKA